MLLSVRTWFKLIQPNNVEHWGLHFMKARSYWEKDDMNCDICLLKDSTRGETLAGILFSNSQVKGNFLRKVLHATI
jgi:hypothetical protein